MSILLLRVVGVLVVVAGVLLAVYVFFFLRMPVRAINIDPRFLLSPANGQIIKILRIENVQSIAIEKNHKKALRSFIGDLDGPVTMISIMMTPMDVHRQRMPYNAKIIHQKYCTGNFLNAIKNPSMLKATLENEHNIITCQTSQGTRFKVIQIAGTLARRIKSFVNVGDVCKKGDVRGVIKLGSQVTIIFDNSVEVLAKEGQICIDGETILGQFLHHEKNPH